MSKILVLAESGQGKSTALRALPPPGTAIINCDKKELPLRGWRKNYVTLRGSDGKVDFAKSNYVETNVPSVVLGCLQKWEKEPRISTMVVDTITHMITRDYMTNSIGKDYKSYQQMGKNFFDIVEFIRESKKNVIVNAHVAKRITDTGDILWDMKSHGNMIKDLVPASYFTTVLIGEVQRPKDEKPRYVFRTQSEGNDPAKSPAFVDGDTVISALEYYEPNDIQLILTKLEEFETNTSL